MMAIEYVSVGRNVIETVVMTIGRRRPRAIDAERPTGNEKAIESVGYEVNADRRDDQPGRIDRFTSVECYDPERNRAQCSNRCPQEFRLQRA